MINVNKISFNGWQNCYKVSNGVIDLIVTSDVGPRIIFFGFSGAENQFYVNEKESGLTGADHWIAYGGHRFWHAPEDPVRTYSPDNQPLQVEPIENGIRITQPIEPVGIQKIIEIVMSKKEPKVKINHILINKNLWQIPAAAWALSVMRAGGMAVIPQSPRVDFPTRLLPTHSITLWGYTKMDDPRWTWGEKYFFLRQDGTAKKPQKLGCMNTLGWAAYLNNGTAFIKQFDFDPDETYPDYNCNFETFTDSYMLEMESLSPLVHIEPGKQIEHLETWSLAGNVALPKNDAEVDQIILPLLNDRF